MFGSAPASKRSLTVSRCPYWARSIKYWAGREFDHSALLHNGQSLTESLGLSLCHFANSSFNFAMITSRSNLTLNDKKCSPEQRNAELSPYPRWSGSRWGCWGRWSTRRSQSAKQSFLSLSLSPSPTSECPAQAAR